MFYTRFQEICKSKGLKPYAVLKKLGISSGSVSHWKDGTVPSGEILKKIADYLDLSIEYLLFDDEIAIRPGKLKRAKSFKSLYALPQRWDSFRSGENVEAEKILRIIKYVNCSIHFISNSSVVKYSPEKEYDETTILDDDTLFDILDILDSCADSAAFRDLQIQLSRVVLYNLKQKGFNDKIISETFDIDNDKLNYLYTGNENEDKTKNYGLNYSDLSILRTLTGLSYRYMFSGIEKSIIVLSREKLRV